jgi:ADP-ribose pyrophosphatase YjhB (NUDIX family)
MNFALKQIRRYAQAALGIILRHPLVGTSIIPVLPDGRVVLVQRRDNGKWSLPGGMLDWGENLPTCIRRELKEETGLDLITTLNPIAIQGFTVFASLLRLKSQVNLRFKMN